MLLAVVHVILARCSGALFIERMNLSASLYSALCLGFTLLSLMCLMYMCVLSVQCFFSCSSIMVCNFSASEITVCLFAVVMWWHKAEPAMSAKQKNNNDDERSKYIIGNQNQRNDFPSQPFGHRKRVFEIFVTRCKRMWVHIVCLYKMYMHRSKCRIRNHTHTHTCMHVESGIHLALYLFILWWHLCWCLNLDILFTAQLKCSSTWHQIPIPSLKQFCTHLDSVENSNWNR